MYVTLLLLICSSLIAVHVFVLKRDVKLKPTNQPTNMAFNFYVENISASTGVGVWLPNMLEDTFSSLWLWRLRPTLDRIINKTSGYATWFTAEGAIRTAHYDVIDDVITRKLQQIEKHGDHLAPWNPLSYPMVKTASLYNNFCKTGNYVIYDVIIWVQDGNGKKWLERILVLVRSTI